MDSQQEVGGEGRQPMAETRQQTSSCTSESEEDDVGSVCTNETVDSKSKEVSKVKVNKMVQWSGYNKKQAVLLFKADAIIRKLAEYRVLGDKYHMSFKMYKTECKLVRNTLTTHGFHEAHPNSNEFSLLWTGSHLKPYVLRAMTEFQKVNHFPRSYEITRKDRLYRNVQRMQQVKGFKHFDFVPLSFICPGEFQDFCSAFLREKGTWIVKPIASSRGRGIFLVSHPDQLPLDETYIVSRYVAKPLLVDGFKFDLRIYVAVTSYDPLVVYLYEEGLSRFATVRYDQKTTKNIKNHCMHLTNYSVNKKSGDFVQNEDPEVEDFGNKWSLGALLRCLRAEGHDTTAIMMRIEDAIIKTLISVETAIATACKMFMPHRGNCFELYGFDVLIDSALRPWVLEVNLSPSLACDSPIDLKIKSHVVADLFSLTGFVLHDPMLRVPSQTKRNQEVAAKNPARQQEGNTNNSSSPTQPPADVNHLPSNTASLSAATPSGPQICALFEATAPPAGSLPANSSSCQTSATTSSTACHVSQLKRVRPGSANSVPSSGSVSFVSRAKTAGSRKQIRPSSGRLRGSSSSKLSAPDGIAPLTQEEAKIVRRVKEEHARRGGWVRIFPTAESWDLYSPFLQYPSNNNLMLHQRLFPDRYTQYSNSKGAMSNPSTANKLRLNVHTMPSHAFVSNGSVEGCITVPPLVVNKMERFLTSGIQRAMLYERKLGQSVTTRRRNKKTTPKKPPGGREDSDVEEEISLPLAQGLSATPSSVVHQEEPPASAPDTAVAEPLFEGGRELVQNYLSTHKSNKPIAMVEPVLQQQGDDIPVPQQPTGKVKSDFDLVAELKRGCILTKSQARFSFATYLTRVQYRLMSETKNMATENLELANEQMDLVLRFLKRAAVNLAQPFKVVVPSRRLAVNDRRRMLAKQLGDFVHIYNKETDTLHSANSRRDLLAISNEKRVSQEKLEEFIRSAEEAELELVLTTYTKINKSASIFLGKGDDHSGRQTAVQPRCNSSQRPATNMHGIIVNGTEGTSTWKDGCSPQDSAPDMQKRGRDPAASAAAKSSFQNAVYIYSGKLTGTQPKQRPSSALPATRTQNSITVRTNRPSSANLNKLSQPAESVSKSAFDENMEDVNEALQQLTLRQQERNYYTSNVPKASKPPADISHRLGGEPRKHVRHTSAKHTNMDRVPTANKQERSKDDSCCLYSGAGDGLMSQYQAELPSDSSGQFRPRNSNQFALLKQKESNKQDQLLQQSKALLEASKAKHQAMVAQAHAATKRLQEDGDVPFAPRPPRSPAAKHHTAHPLRSRGTSSMLRSHSQDDISSDFYSNLKYDTATGKARLMRPGKDTLH